MGDDLVADNVNPADTGPETFNNAPIGVFDSGVGGLTVARTIVDQLPHESLIYIGDTAHSPYGDKSLDDVRTYARAVADDLVARGCKMIVIACNSASAAFADTAIEDYDVPVIPVILPAVKRATSTTHNRKVGVIGTAATVSSGEYARTFERYIAEEGLAEVKVYSQACPLFVPFVER